MTKILYKFRWVLLAGFLGFVAIFSGTIHFNFESGEQIEKPDMYKLLSYWWIALTCLYFYWIAETYQGKTKVSTKLKRLLIMAIPTIFVLLATYATSKFITGT